LEEIYEIDPEIVIAFGNQVSSILLDKKITVSNYKKTERESLVIKDKQFDVYPCYYPVGQGMRNIKKATNRIKAILD
jgi:DNA polymerase